MAPSPAHRPGIGDLFRSFLRLGASSFGGPAIVPHIRELAVAEKSWIDGATFDRGNALAQVLPGAISVQVATYIGLQVRGLPGAAAACAGYILPAFLFMIGLSAAYASWHTAAEQAAFRGLRAVVIAILAHAAVLSWRAYIKNTAAAGLALVAALAFILGVNPVPVIIGAGIAGRLALPPVLAGAAPPNGPAAIRPGAIAVLLAGVLSGFVLMYILDPTLLPLALLMAKIDLFAFGGGYTSVPLMFHEIVNVRGWLDGTTLLDGIALGQLTPGPIVITATFVGFLLKGLTGAAVATICVFFPSFLLVVLLSTYLHRLQQKKSFDQLIHGILCSFVGLLGSSVVRFSETMEWSPALWLIATGAFAALCLRVPILITLAGGIAAALLAL